MLVCMQLSAHSSSDYWMHCEYAQVSNATLVDAAKFECQVGPGRGNPPIRANARLTVTCEKKLARQLKKMRTKGVLSPVYVSYSVPPTRVELIGESAGGRLEVPEHQQVTFRSHQLDTLL